MGVSIVKPVWAETESTTKQTATNQAAIGKDEALKLAKQFVDIPLGYTLENSNFNSNDRFYHPQWNFNFVKKSKNIYVGNINVVIDAKTSELQSFSVYEQSQQPTSFPPKVSYEEAKKIASDYLLKLFPKRTAEWMLNSDSDIYQKPNLQGNTMYSINFSRVHKGLPLIDNNLTVNIDGNGKILSFYQNWMDIAQFEPKTSPMISLEKAKEIYLKNVKLEPIIRFNYGNAPGFRYVYDINYDPAQFAMIDPKSGAGLDGAGNPVKTVTGSRSMLSDKLLAKPPIERKTAMTKEEALALIKQSIPLPSNLELINVNFNDGNQPLSRSVWNFNWRVAQKDAKGKTTVKEDGYVYASIDAKTGELINFGHDDYRIYQQKSYTPKYTMETAKVKAIGLLKKLAPDKMNQIYYEVYPGIDTKTKQRVYNFNFTRLYQGIRVEGNNLSISIDSVTGEVRNYSLNWNTGLDAKLPKFISVNEAKKIWMDRTRIELSYYLFQLNKVMQETYKGVKSPLIAKLAYRISMKPYDEPIYLDAVTGKWKNFESGKEVLLDQPYPDDIKGLSSETALALMLQFKAIDLIDGKAMPAKEVKRGEMIKMLMIAMNGGYYAPYYAERKASFADVAQSSPYFSYVEGALDAKLIDEGENFNPEATITKEELAVWIVRALGYDGLAKHEALFKLNVNDASQVKNKGQAAITLELGIFQADNNNFAPATVMTRESAAVAFYHFLEARSQLQDSKPGGYHGPY